MELQSSWLYLEPIFSSPDIVNQIPQEGKKFKDIDKGWAKFMEEVLKNSNVIEVTKCENLLEKLQNYNVLAEEIMKGLNTYLELKVQFFSLIQASILSKIFLLV